jgi:TonB family protein
MHGVVSYALSCRGVRFSTDVQRAFTFTPPLHGPAGSTAANELDLDLPFAASVATPADVPDPVGSPPVLGGGDAIPRVDTHERGRGGEAHVDQPAVDLADRDERLRLSPELMNRLDRDQIQRLRVSRDRQSWDDRRATVHPTELSFILSGLGTVRERRSYAPTLPSRGEMLSRRPSTPRSSDGDPRPSEDPGRYGGKVRGASDAAPGLGVAQARPGADHRTAAPIASERPSVTEGPVAMPARNVGRPSDDVDSEQQVATTVRALVHASTAGGVLGSGVGGSPGLGGPGAAGTVGAGSRSRPLGLGDAEVFDYWTTDARLMPYFRQMHARIEPLWANAFPKAALLDLKQGTVILEFTIAADGRIAVGWPPLRPSGIDEFDRNCAEAVRRASPLPAIPPELGLRTLRVRAPFVASNPVVK